MLHSHHPKFTDSAVLGREQGIEPSEGPHRLFEHLVAEVQALGVDIAVVTTGANTLNDWRIPIGPADIARFAPHVGTLKALLPVLDNNHTLNSPLAADLHGFIAEVEAARAVLNGYLDDCEAISPERAGLVHARLLRNSWRALSFEAKRIINAMERAGPAPLPELYVQNTRVVSALLSGAGNGLKPCLDEHGRLYVPPLPQRRRSPRRTLLQNCVVHSPGQSEQTGFIRDASAGGLGLGRVSGLKRGVRVRVDLASGRQLHGFIAWVTGSSAGLQFDVPLEPSDNLISL